MPLKKIKPITLIEILPYHHDYLKDILKLSDEALGENYLSENEFYQIGKSPDYYCFVGLYDKIFAGFSFFQLVKPENLVQIFDEHIVKLVLQNCQNNKPVGYRKHTAVRPEFRNLGIGTLLVKSSNEMLKSLAGCIITTVWENKKDFMLKILIKEGFKRLLSIPDFWYKSSLEMGYECPLCGNPCHCEASLLIKRL